MNRRERILAAIDRKEPDLVPITDFGLDPPIIENITAEKVEGFSLMSTMSIDKNRPSRNVWESSKQNMLRMIQACDILDFDALMIHGYNLLHYDYTPKVIGEDTFIDEWGRIQKVRGDTKTTWWVGGVVKTREDLDEYEPPNPHESGRYELLQYALKNIKNDTAVIGMFPSGFVITWQIMGGIDKLILNLYKDAGFVKKTREIVQEACVEWIKMMLDVGLDAFVLSEDYADTHGPFLRPDLFRDFELPFFNKAVDEIRTRGVPVLKHSDGNLYPIMEDLIKGGMDGLHPIEPGAMDIADVKQRYGDRICVMGNVDCRYILPYGSETEVRKEVRRVIDEASAGGGHILTSSNSLHSNVKVDNIFIMVDEARKYGRYQKK